MRYEWLRDAVNEDTIDVASFTAFNGDAESNELYYGLARDGCVALAENFEKTFTLSTRTEINGGMAYPTFLFSGLDDIYLGGTETSPTIEIGWALKIDDAIGTIDSGYPGSIIDRPDLDGTYTSEAIRLNVAEFGVLRWNEVLTPGGDIVFSTRTSATEAGLAGESWDGGLTNPSGSLIASTPNTWFQFKVDFTTADIQETPKIVTQEGFAIQLVYKAGGNESTADIPFIYDTGLKDGGAPHEDKILKKIVVVASGVGSYDLDWETETGEAGAFNVDLSMYPIRFETFFQDNSYGRHFRFKITKTDTNPFTLKEFLGIYTPRPVII